MNDYTKTDFHHYLDMETNTRRYYIKVCGTFIEVSKDIYYTCYNSYRKQIRDNRKDHAYGLVSYDVLLPDGHSMLDIYGKSYDYLEDIYKKDMLKAVMNLIEALDDGDRELIIGLLIEEQKESDLAKKYQVSQQTINRRKKKIIKSLREKLNEGYKKIKSLLFF